MRINIKSIIVLLVVSFMPMAVKGETVSQKEAMKLAETFFNAMYGEVSAPPKLEWNGKKLTTDRLFSPFYVYNHPKGGFVIISAENKAYPVLAYSRTNKFNKDNLGEEETQLIKKYAKEIELIRYDSRLPENVLYAWQHIPEYFNNVINSPYSTPEFRRLDDDTKEMIERIDRRNSWIVMPSAVEFDIYDPREYRDITLDDVTGEDEEVPFEFYEDFLKTVRAEAEAREIEFEEILHPSKPVVHPLGGGHYEIVLPEPVAMMRVYSLQGAVVTEKYYKDTEVVNLNMESLPSGFYAGLVLTENGNIFGFKLFR